MDENIESAIKLLRESNYIVTRITQSMSDDMGECVRLGEEGVDKDCEGCSCNVCILNQ